MGVSGIGPIPPIGGQSGERAPNVQQSFLTLMNQFTSIHNGEMPNTEDVDDATKGLLQIILGDANIQNQETNNKQMEYWMDTIPQGKALDSPVAVAKFLGHLANFALNGNETVPSQWGCFPTAGSKQAQKTLTNFLNNNPLPKDDAGAIQWLKNLYLAASGSST